MSRLFFAAVLAIVPAFAAMSVHAQDAQRFERVAGIRSAAATTFFQRLRVAVGGDNKARACALIAYPLTHATGVVADASQCEARYDSIFTIEVRKAIGKQAADELFVNDRGVMVGNGEVWFAGRCGAPPCGADDIRIVAIASDAAALTPPSGKLLLSCAASGQLIHVTADGAGGAEMRLWRAIAADAAPTTVVPKASEFSRDDTCGARTWTFADGTTRYTLSDLACDAHLAPPPMGSVGELVVRREGREDVRFWCQQ